MRINSINGIKCYNPAFVKKSTCEKKDIKCSKQNDVIRTYYTPSNISFGINRKKDRADYMLEELSNNRIINPSAVQEIENLKGDEAKTFIEKYCRLTGFPNLVKVNSNMMSMVLDAMKNAAQKTDTTIIESAFHKGCSVACGLGLPGSDMDGTAILIDGTKEQVNEFKEHIWENYNPVFIDIRKEFEFPDIFSIEQAYEWANFTNKIIEQSDMPSKFAEYEQNLTEKEDFFKAYAFNIDLGHELEKYSAKECISNAPSLSDTLTYETPKKLTMSLSSAFESIRSGVKMIKNKNLTEEQKTKMDYIKNSYLYKYGNCCMQEADFGLKPKLEYRKNFINRENFDKLTQEEQLKLISRIILESFPSYSKKGMHFNCEKAFQELFENTHDLNTSRIEAIREASE